MLKVLFFINLFVFLQGCTAIGDTRGARLKIDCSDCQVTYDKEKTILSKDLQIKGHK